jgi:hypothetical protein
MIGFLWGLTTCALLKATFGFSAAPQDDLKGDEGYHRLITLFAKNKYGFHTRFMSDFDLFLEAVLNDKFVEDCSHYYDDITLGKEIEDMELGLNGDFTKADVRHLVKDPDHGHAAPFKSLMRPDRVATNYPKGDALSCYKILPKGEMPRV